VLIPANRLDRAKGRLGSLLSADERARLFLAMLETVVEAARGCGLSVTVLTSDARIPERISTPVAILPEDPALDGLNAQLEAAVHKIGIEAVLILHADLPLATAGAIQQVLEAAGPAPSATLVPSPDGGTNAMLVAPPGGFALAYGRGSAALHVAAASEAGYAVRAVSVPELAFDVDAVDDLWALMGAPGAAATRAGRLLQELALRERLAVDS
jgi:2-phospho-L-lactate guanylyltransferase